MPPAIILIRPQMGENIGAVARAMKNFSLSELRIVAPRDGWPNPKAVTMATGAEDIIDGAKIYSSFAEAVKDIKIIYATTARGRDINKPVIPPQQAAQEIQEYYSNGVECAFIFGPERTGIENEEITICDKIITIPTGEKASLNLAQSMVIIGYEWIKNQNNKVAYSDIAVPAPKEDMFGLFTQLEDYLDKSRYFSTAHKKPLMWQNIRNMLLRGSWSSQEIRTLRGMLRNLWEHRD